MFDVAVDFIVQMVELIPVVFAMYIIFDFMGSLLFGKK